MTGVRALVVENDPFTLTTLVNALAFRRITVIVQATTSREALDLLGDHDVDVALLDLDLGVGPTGIDLAHALRLRQPEAGLVLLTSYSDPRLMTPEMVQPPRGTRYLSKSEITDFSAVADAVLAAAHSPLSPQGSQSRVAPSLTESQLEVLRLVADGLSTQSIADRRHVSVKAVEQMIRRLIEVLDITRDGSTNVHVQLARSYLELAGKIEGQEVE